MHRSWFRLFLFLGFTSLAAGNAADSTPSAPAVSELQSLYAQTAQTVQRLRRDPTVSADAWADAHIFLKAAEWALDLETNLTADLRSQIHRALQRAQQRADALQSHSTPWTSQPGKWARGFVSKVDDSTQPYGLFVPARYSPDHPIRLDVVLHGSSGARASGIGDWAFLRTFDAGDSSTSIPDRDYIEVHPMGRLGENAYRFEGETDVFECIESVCRQYNIDRQRIVLRGSSLGGVGAWQIGLKHPGRFAAVGPAAGPVDTLEFSRSPWPHFIPLDPFTPWQKSLLHLVDAIDYTANARLVPIVAAMGAKDPYLSSHRLIERAFQTEGIPFAGLVDPNAGHGLGASILQEQLRQLGTHAAQGIPRAPDRVQFVTWTLRYPRAFWVELQGLSQHYNKATVDARLLPDSSVEIIAVTNITRLALYPPALSQPNATLRIRNTSIPLPSARSAQEPILLENLGNEWRSLPKSVPTESLRKIPGLQGPVDDAFATRFLCVRGTGTPWNPAIGRWADANLRRFADEWRRHYRGHLPIKNDTEVSAEDLRACNLILFGDPGSNLWIRRALPRLPIRWTPTELQLGDQILSSSQHGIALIHPNPLPGAAGRYLVLNSGHTYHDPELRLSYMVYPRLGDWALFQLTSPAPSAPPHEIGETVLTSGFFDEAWSAPVKIQPLARP